MGLRFPSVLGLSPFGMSYNSPSKPHSPRAWPLGPAGPSSPLFCPLRHLLLSGLAAAGQAVRAAAPGLPLRRQLLAELLQLPLIHEPLLLKCTPLFFQVLFLQDLNHVLNWVWWAKRQGKVSSVVAKTGSQPVLLHQEPPPPSPRTWPFDVLSSRGLSSPVGNPSSYLFTNVLAKFHISKYVIFFNLMSLS